MTEAALSSETAARLFSDLHSRASQGALSYEALTQATDLLIGAKNFELASHFYSVWLANTVSPIGHIAYADLGDLLIEANDYPAAEIAFMRSLMLNGTFERSLRSLATVRAVVRSTIVNGPYGIFNIELTNKCPFKCVMCPRTESMTRSQGFMEFDLFRSIVDQIVADMPAFRSQIVWLHHFGESLLHPEFDRFINYAADRGMRLGLSLNPLLVKGPTAERLLNSRLELMYVSLDGHDDESFDKIRGVKNAYGQSKQNLLEFLEKKLASGSRTKIQLSMINFSLNAESIAEMESFWRAQPGIDEFLSKEFVTFSGDSESLNRLNPEVKQRTSLPFVSCRLPWNLMTIAWDGDVVPCCYDYDKKYILGNVSNSALSEIWNGAAMQALREEFNSGSVTNPLCRNCPNLR